jgi:peptide deformylase
MPSLDIIIAPDAKLKRKCEPVACVDDAVSSIMGNMLKKMYLAPGIGLAAPQVDILKRIIVIDCARGGIPSAPYMMANPKVLWSSDNQKFHEEGCLSLPQYYALVARPDKIRVSYIDQYNNQQIIEADGLLSVVIQHEIDHLDGILFVDHISPVKRSMILRKLRKTKQQSVR